MNERVILAIDEGTTGTRAALVSDRGAVSRLAYRRLSVHAPRPGVVEQDADEIWERTLDACREAASGASVAGVAISTQRATSVLWDARTSRALAPAMVWQDARHAEDLGRLAGAWDAGLLATTGRPVGTRSPYLWAARHIERTPEVREAFQSGALRFGSIDSWLLWRLTDGRTYATTATNACAAGGYVLDNHSYHGDWIETLGFPLDLLPELREDGEDLGRVAPGLLPGGEVPILAAVGDQHAGALGLGCLERGQSMCVHGTGSFVDVVAGAAAPRNSGEVDGALVLVGWRHRRRSEFTVESYSSTTGSALDWVCATFSGLGSARAVSDLAASVPDAAGVTFLPTLAGLRTPVMEPRMGSGLSGLTMATTPAHIAHAVLDGIAHAVSDSAEAVAHVTDAPITSMQVGGGLSASDPLMRMQADLLGVPMVRVRAAESASLRGAAYLAGSRGLFWDSLEQAARTRGPEDVFEPRIGADERSSRRETWKWRIRAELQLLDRPWTGG